jgi:hypothetical protein
VRAESDTFEGADQQLWERILERWGDGENLRDYRPPAPTASGLSDLLEPRLVRVSGNTQAWGVTPAEELFEGGRCGACSSPRGPRNATPISVELIESGYDGAFAHGVRVLLFSEDFLKLLARRERNALEWRPVVRRKTARKAFFELLTRPSVPLVGTRRLGFEPARCETCRGAAGFFFWDPARPQLTQFVCRADLPEADLFVAGSPQTTVLTLRAERWARMRGKPGARGLVAEDLGVVPEADAVREPALPLKVWYRRQEERRLAFVKRNRGGAR